MLVNTNALVSMTDANQNFSKVAHIVDESGLAVILKNNKPRYILVDFEEYDNLKTIQQARAARIEETADILIAENLEAFEELSK